MALTPETRVTLADTLAVTDGPAGTIRVTGFDAYIAVNYPTAFTRTTEFDAFVAARDGETLRTSGLDTLVAARDGETLRVTEAAVLVAVRGRVANPKLRAWTFSLDGHDFYVLRLGMILTLVYDAYSEQWMDWNAFTEIYWPVNIGVNWVGGTGQLNTAGDSFGSNVLVGDDTHGLLWFLDPNQPYDQSPDGPLDPVQEKYFERVTMGQVPTVGRGVLPCYSVWLTTDIGDPAYFGAGVTLSISDDAGKSFDDMGLVTVTLGENSPELAWYSLGQIQAPGRLFMIVDDGAIARIDGMEMNDPDDTK